MRKIDRLVILLLSIALAILVTIKLPHRLLIVDTVLIGFVLGLIATLTRTRETGELIAKTGNWRKRMIPRNVDTILSLLATAIFIGVFIYTPIDSDPAVFIQDPLLYIILVLIIITIEDRLDMRIYEKGFSRGFRFYTWEEAVIKYDIANPGLPELPDTVDIEIKYTPGITFPDTIVIRENTEVIKQLRKAIEGARPENANTSR